MDGIIKKKKKIEIKVGHVCKMIAFGVFFFGCWGRFACCSLERS